MVDAVVEGTTASLIVVTALAACYLIPSLAFARVSRRQPERAQGWVFVAPLIAIIALLVLAPTVRTAYLSFFDKAGDEFVGVKNWRWALSSETAISALRNNALWVVGVTACTMVIGFVVAVGSDLFAKPSFVRAAVFAPMAISAVGATIIWQLVYAYKPLGSEQTGLLNALVVGAGGNPRAWLVDQPTNTWFLIWIMIWTWTGFATVVFAAALRTVPSEVIEAAQLDGATPIQILRRVVLPTIRTTTAVVLVGTVVTVLKVFDIVRVATNGQFNTNVIANEMLKQAINRRDTGRASALAILLLVLIIPFMGYSAWQIRRQAQTR
jgi:alpha-glucoside transport system permease protein